MSGKRPKRPNAPDKKPKLKPKGSDKKPRRPKDRELRLRKRRVANAKKLKLLSAQDRKLKPKPRESDLRLRRLSACARRPKQKLRG